MLQLWAIQLFRYKVDSIDNVDQWNWYEIMIDINDDLREISRKEIDFL